ncbi:MAG: ABC transporter ATP-binding protein [Solirubrobacterales bacterium]
MSTIDLKNIYKEYNSGEAASVALKDLNFTAEKDDMIAIMGPSGSGKTTLLNILGCMDVATKGDYILDGENINNCTKKQLSQIRSEKFGFVFQQFALIPEFTVTENVELPMVYGNYFKNFKDKIGKKARLEMSKKVLDDLGLGDHLNKTPAQLSGGQQQRVAIARAIVSNPEIILADEPTGALDQKTGKEIMNILKSINEQGKLVIIITHNPNVASYCKKVINVVDGEIQVG